MSYPSDVVLPANAKYFGFIDSKNAYNSHWDIVWSFTYALTGTQHGFCTFLTTNPTLSTAIPGQYLGYLGNIAYLTSESGDILLTEEGLRLTYDTLTLSSYETTGILSIAFDSTGYFALSTTTNYGVPITQTKQNSLVVRDSNNRVIFNEALSSLDTNFVLASSVKTYQTLRFRLSNAGKKLYVDYKTPTESYKNLTTISISSFDAESNTILYPGLTFCSPISSNSITPSTMFISNFHTQGNVEDPTYETLECIPLLTNDTIVYTTISGISATPV